MLGHGDFFLLYDFPQVSQRCMNLWSLVLMLPVLFALVCDLRTREIPDWIPLGTLAWPCLATALRPSRGHLVLA